MNPGYLVHGYERHVSLTSDAGQGVMFLLYGSPQASNRESASDLGIRSPSVVWRFLLGMMRIRG